MGTYKQAVQLIAGQTFTITDPNFTFPSSKLAFLNTPVNTFQNSTIPDVQVAIEDSQGTIIPDDNHVVTLALGNNPGNGHLLGTLSVTPVNGVATFKGLQIDSHPDGHVRPDRSDQQSVQHRVARGHSQKVGLQRAAVKR